MHIAAEDSADSRIRGPGILRGARDVDAVKFYARASSRALGPSRLAVQRAAAGIRGELADLDRFAVAAHDAGEFVECEPAVECRALDVETAGEIVAGRFVERHVEAGECREGRARFIHQLDGAAAQDDARDGDARLRVLARRGREDRRPACHGRRASSLSAHSRDGRGRGRLSSDFIRCRRLR